MSILGSVISGLFGIGQQASSNAYNRKEAEKNRDFQSAEAEKNREFQSAEAELARIFNSNEAALQRDWSSQEAEQARDWQEEMYAKYNSLSGKIAQAEQAGVNPMFAITGNAVSPMVTTSSAPSGSSASAGGVPSGSAPSGSAATNGMLNILGAVLDAAKLKSEIDLNNAQANSFNTGSEISLRKVAHEIANLDADTAYTNQKLSESAQNVELLKKQLSLTEKQAELFASQISHLDAETERINSLKDLEKRELEAKVLFDEWNEKNKETFKAIDIGAEGLKILTDLGLGILSSKTGIKIAEIKNLK